LLVKPILDVTKQLEQQNYAGESRAAIAESQAVRL